MQSVLSRIWTRIAVSISYDANHYTTIAPPKRLKSLCYYHIGICMSYYVYKDLFTALGLSITAGREPQWECNLVGASSKECCEKEENKLCLTVSEREGKQVLLWKCCFDNSLKDMTCDERRNKSVSIVCYIYGFQSRCLAKERVFPLWPSKC